jgi:hypothetical protein
MSSLNMSLLSALLSTEQVVHCHIGSNVYCLL